MHVYSLDSLNVDLSSLSNTSILDLVDCQTHVIMGLAYAWA